MTIARKLWLSFGGLILIFLLAGLLIFFSERSVRSALDEIANVEEPTRVASFEMEINAVAMNQDVRDYVDTGDPQYRELFADHRADFEMFQARHAELVDTPRGRKHVARIDSIYEEYVALGEDLIAERGELGGGSIEPLRADMQRFAELQAELDGVLDEEVQPWAGQQLVEAEESANRAIRNVYA